MRHFIGICLILICLGIAYNYGPDCLDAVKLEKDFQQQKDDYARQANASSGIYAVLATTGYNALDAALQKVEDKKQEDEIFLGIAGVGLLLGIFLTFKRSRPTVVAATEAA